LTARRYLLINENMRRKSDQLIPLEASILEAAVALRSRGTPLFHGYALAKVIRTEADRRLLTAHGTLYRALQRLERGGLLESFWEDAVPAEREGRPRRRLYRITALGERALGRVRAQRRSVEGARGLEPRLETP
jgi:DNA-binding transcriptional ArsR family regulator